MHEERTCFPPMGLQARARESPSAIPPWSLSPSPSPLQPGDACTYRSSSRLAGGNELSVSELGQTGWGAGWVGGLKGRCRGDVSLPRWLTPAPPPCQRNPSRSPPPAPPVTPHRLHIWGKTPSWSSLPGAARDILCVLWRWSRRGRSCAAGWEAAGKSLLWTGPRSPALLSGPRAAPSALLPAPVCDLTGGGNSRGSGQGEGERAGGQIPEVRGGVTHHPVLLRVRL